MKGGAIEINPQYINISVDEAFIIFEQNSVKTFYKQGTTGLLFLLKLKEGISSPFVSLNPMGEEVKTLIVKYVLFSSTRYFFKHINQDNKYKKIETVTQDEIIKECDIQRYVYETSNGYISPICPFVNVEQINGRDPENIYVEQSERGDKRNILHFGFIAMELPNNCEPLHKKSEENPIWDAISIFEILRLLFESSIIHGDLHGGNILILEDASYFGAICPYRATIIDYGRSFDYTRTFEKAKKKSSTYDGKPMIFEQITKKKPATYNDKTMTFEKACEDYRNLKIMMDFIYDYGYFYNGKLKDYFSKQYEWIKNDSVLTSIFSILHDLYKNRQMQIGKIMGTYRQYVSISDITSNHQGMPIIDMIFVQDIISQGLQQRELEAAAAAERQRLAAEAEQQRLIQAELNSIDSQAARHHILNPPQVESINLNNLSIIAGIYNLSQFNLFQKLKELLVLSQNTITQDIIDLIYTIGYLQQSQGTLIGGAAPAITTEYSLNQLTQQSKKGSNKKDNQIQAKIAEIKQIQSTMADTFAEWRNEVYDIYTNPNVEERNAYYQEQTPFTILTHLMVCCGLFGPLKSGNYIDVKEEENKELYDKLNSIAAAFLTINNGYLSMSNVKTQLMIEDAKKASVSVPVNEKVEVQLEGPTVEVSQPGKPLTESMFDTREEIAAGFGGNKKYSRRKRRRHSKRQKKRCRRKSNKRFYSKKSTKNRRKYSKR